MSTTVQTLIDELQKIEDKSAEVFYRHLIFTPHGNCIKQSSAITKIDLDCINTMHQMPKTTVFLHN